MKVIVCATNKGGDGKTTLSILLSDYLSQVLNKKVLGADLDPQANFSKNYLNIEYDPVYKDGKIPPLHPEFDPDVDLDWNGRSTIANIYYGEPLIPYPTFSKNMDILPAHSYKLQQAEAVTRDEVTERIHVQLKKFINLEDVSTLYDVIVIDTPPSKGPLTISAFKAATDIVIPCQMEEDSVEGLYGMMQLWKQETYERGADNPIKIAGIVGNRVKNVTLHENFFSQLKSLESTRNYVLEQKIKERVIYGELRVKEDYPKSVFSLPPDHPARKECELVCATIIGRVFNHG